MGGAAVRTFAASDAPHPKSTTINDPSSRADEAATTSRIAAGASIGLSTVLFSMAV